MSARLFTRVLVPLELIPSERGMPDAMAARECIEATARLAKGGKICFVHATPVATESTFFGVPEIGGPIEYPATTEPDEGLRMIVQSVIEDVAEQVLAHRADYEVHVGSGHAADVILAQADAFHADLIVLPKMVGQTPSDRMVVGPTADEVMRRASCPVLMIPTGSVPAAERLAGRPRKGQEPRARHVIDMATSW